VENERENRLRQQIEELVRSRVGVLEQDISHLQREFNASFTRLLERTDAAASLPEAEPLIAQLAAQVTAEIDQATTSSVRLIADIALLRDSVSELNDQRNQAEVLNTLVARAANFAPRVVLYVVKSGNALAWAARGFDDNVGNNSVRGMSVSLQNDTVLRAAVSEAQTCYGAPDQQSENNLLFSRFGNTQPQRVLVVPLKVRGKAAAILYADSADRGESSINVEAIELLVSTAGLVVELVSLRSRMGDSGSLARAPQAEPKPAAPSAGMSGPLPAPEAAPEPTPEPVQEATPEPAPVEPVQPSVEAEAPVEAAPSVEATPPAVEEQAPTPVEEAPAESPAAEEPQTHFAESGFTPEPASPVLQPWADTSPPAAIGFAPPTPAAPPAHSFEAEPAASYGFEVTPSAPPETFIAPPISPVPEPPVFTFGDAAAQPAAPPVALPEPSAISPEEEKLHNDAKRFARLLVSEIKLYNEQKVSAGRENRDLYDRLKDDIDRSRQMYDKRYGTTAVSSFNYFYNEMVNTLAEGDASKLRGYEM